MNRFESVSKLLMWFMALLLVALAAGCGGGGGGRDPILGSAGSAALAPTVTAVAPLNNATGVPINTKKITAAFSKAMDSATLTTASFTLACPAGTPVTGGVVSYSAAGNVATLTLPAANLPASTACTATITTGAKDTVGIALASNYVWHFTTGVTPDTTKPRVTVTVPVNLAVVAPTNAAITATFNESMAPATITGASFTLTCATCVVTAPAGNVSYAVGSKTAIFTPTAPLVTGKTYTATIKGTGASPATDLAGNALAGGVSTTVAADYVWTFTAATPDVTPPTVTVVNPPHLATGVCLNKTINATFSEAMNSGTITTATFTLAPTATPGSPVTRVVAYDPLTNIASLNPTANLTASTNYTATIKGGASGVKDLAGNALVVDKVWTFDTGTTLCVAPVNLGTASTFGIASAGGVTNTATAPLTDINGDALLNPNTTCNAVPVDAAGGFGACGGFAPTITGTVISSLYNPGGNMATIQSDFLAAYNSLSPANLPGATVLGCGTIGSAGGAGAGIGCAGNSTLAPGVYISATASTIGVTGVLTLDGGGDSNAVFVFQAPSALTTAAGAPGVPGSRINLIGGAKASNVWWWVGGSGAATIGTYADFNGTVLGSGAITINTGATSCGRLLSGALGAGTLTLDTNIISVPGQPFVPPAGYSPVCQ